MTRKRRAVLDVLASIADGEPVNWDAVGTGDAAPDLRAMRALKIIAGVAELHRSLGEEDDLPAEDASPRVIGRIEPRDEPGGHPGGTPWGPFILREPLGSGAFADVFRAHEPQLDRDVAVKLFKSTRQRGQDRRGRMLREARALARVRHPHVVQVFGADEHDGRLGIWMELVRGRTLETELTERGRWSAREAAAAGQDLCRALAAVHNAGFVHGDIKSQNVIREEGGRLVLMDFGARHVRESAPLATVSGTPMYLAPEVLAGGAPTVASDVYSFGVLLYHLVTGSYPVAAASLEELRARHERRQTTRVSDARPDLDPACVRVIERALAVDPADRFQSAGEMEAALAQILGAAARRPTPWVDRFGRVVKAAVAAAAVLAVAAAAVILWPPSAPVIDPDSLAVLPFRTAAGQDKTAYLSEGVSADLTSLLARLSIVHLVSGMSVERYRNRDTSPREIGRDLRVRRLLAGTVQLSGDRVSVSAELVDCETSRTIWTDRFERRLDELFSTQSEIARSIGAALRGSLSSHDADLLARKPMPYHAFELYTLGRYHWNKRTPDSLRLAIQYFEEAAAADPTSALPYAGLSDAYVVAEAIGFIPPLEAQRQAEAAALHAVALDSTLAEAYAALGSLRQEQLRWPEAEAALVRAIDLRPGYSPARHWYALYLASHGRFDAATVQMQQALAQDPLSVTMRTAMGFIDYHRGDFQAAINQYEQALQLQDDLVTLPWYTALAYAGAGYPARALEYLDKVRSATPEMTRDLNATRATVYALAHRTAEARALLIQPGGEAAAGSVDGVEQAAARFALGDDALAYEWLGRAAASRVNAVQFLAVDPRFARVRDDARFRALLQQLGLDQVTAGGTAR